MSFLKDPLLKQKGKAEKALKGNNVAELDALKKKHSEEATTLQACFVEMSNLAKGCLHMQHQKELVAAAEIKLQGARMQNKQKELLLARMQPETANKEEHSNASKLQIKQVERLV